MDIEGTAGTDSGDSGSASAAETTAGTTNEIASAVYDELEADSAEEADPAPVETSAPEKAEKMTPAEVSEAERILIKAGFKDAKRGDGREFRIPRSKVIDLFNKQFGELRKESEGKYGSVEKERDGYKNDLTEFVNAIKGDPKAFLETLAGQDPRYQSFLTPQEKRELAADAHDIEPKLVYDQGQDAFDKSMSARLAWERRQGVREAEAKTQALVAPIAEREKAEKQRADAEKAQGEIRTKVRSQMDEAQTWPMFGKIAEDGTLTEFQEEVFAAFKADPALNLHSAYMKVAGPRFTTDEATVRAKVMKEMQDAPKSTALPRSGEAPRKVKSGSIRDAAAEVYDAASKS
jgi:hypothetical protein